MASLATMKPAPENLVAARRRQGGAAAPLRDSVARSSVPQTFPASPIFERLQATGFPALSRRAAMSTCQRALWSRSLRRPSGH